MTKHSFLLVLAALLAGCSALSPQQARQAVDAVREQALVEPSVWQQLVKDHDANAPELGGWFARWNDPVLEAMQTKALEGAPGIKAALARIEQARAAQVGANASGLPTLDLNGRLARTRNVLFPPGLLLETASLLVDAAWELDFYGANALRRDSAQQRLQARVISAHEAQASLAAEVATAHINLLSCALAVEVARRDSEVLGKSEALVESRASAGLASATERSASRAAVLEAANRERAQLEQCDIAFKVMAWLTRQPEAQVRSAYEPRLKLALRQGLPSPGGMRVEPVPARWLAQRPDLLAVEAELVAAQSEIGLAEIARYPRLALTGQVGPAWLFSNVIGNSRGTSWTVAPTLGLPLFDAGRRKAEVQAAKARYAEAAASYTDRASAAAREVEEALVRLQSAQDRRARQAQILEQSLTQSRIAEQRRSVGIAPASETLDAQRAELNARQQVVLLDREVLLAQMTLYKALGAGWQRFAPSSGPMSVPSADRAAERSTTASK
jgi:NodT family efflux transporter outer membrane factor (OMF) lipoprotein